MPIIDSLLIAAPMLQDYFVDNVTNQAMSAGVVTCYKDNSRTTLKNWYYQSGVSGNYTYIRLPNPLTLSASGTITDVNGNDTIPFFYPYSETDNQTREPYYITVDNSDGQRQFSRENFPFIPENPISDQVPTLKNLIVNNVFWRPNGIYNTTTKEYTIDATDETDIVIAPSQHDSFTMPDIRFMKDLTGAEDTITLKPFGQGNSPLSGDITPEYYINHNCTSSQPGESYKFYQFPISLHVKTLESVQATVTIQAQNVGGNVNNQITLSILQFLGSGVSSPDPTLITTLTLTSGWNKFDIEYVFPSSDNLTLSDCNDDALYLQIGMPLAETFNINFTKPSIYLSEEVPTNDFSTYDEIDSIINSPRTGDIRMSMNDFAPFGWVPMNNGTIGNANSNATSRANSDTFPLYNLIWNKMNLHQTYAPMYNNTGSNVAYTDPVVDFNAGNHISLTKQLGSVLAGTSSFIPDETVYTVNTGTSAVNLVIANTPPYAVPYSTGTPVILLNSGGSPPTGLSTGTIYYAIYVNATTIQLASTIENAYAGTSITFSTNGSGTNSIMVYSDFIGLYQGDKTHIQTIAEMARHNHPGSAWNLNAHLYADGANNGPIYGAGSAASNTPVSVAFEGNGNPFNIMQPTTFMNIFIKL